jgi:hypothetical protein
MSPPGQSIDSDGAVKAPGAAVEQDLSLNAEVGWLESAAPSKVLALAPRLRLVVLIEAVHCRAETRLPRRLWHGPMSLIYDSQSQSAGG